MGCSVNVIGPPERALHLWMPFMLPILCSFGAWVTVRAGRDLLVCVLTFQRSIVGEFARVIKRPL